MKILHVLDHSLPLHSGYVFRTLSILREQRQRGWQTVHLTTPRQGVAGTEDEVHEGLRFHRTLHPPAGVMRTPGLRILAEMSATARRIADLVRAERPDVLHAHSPVLDAWPAIRVGRRYGVPVVYEVRAFWEDAAVDHGSTTEGSLRYRASRVLETAAMRRVSAVTTICEGLRNEIVGRGIPAESVTVIPNAVDVERFPLIEARDAALEASLGLSGAEVIGFCGSFYAYEGLDLLLRSFRSVLRERPAARVLLVGGGPEEARLRALAHALGVDSRVTFTGRVPNAEIGRYYSLCDLLAFPRSKMRLTDLVTPLKPLEAMAQGLPVVASDVGGHRELIRDGVTGVLHAAGSDAALADAIVRVLREPALRAALRSAGRRYVESERTWAGSVARYEAVYDRVVSGARQGRGRAGAMRDA